MLQEKLPSHDEMTTSLQGRAFDNLRYIRDTMEATAAFTAVPGLGFSLMGLTALAAAYLAATQAGNDRAWFVTWGIEALLAIVVGFTAMLIKARLAKVNPFKGSARKFTLSFLPPIIAGALVTLVIYQNDLDFVLPGLWLLCYGAGAVTAGAFSTRIIPIMGLCFMALGTVALFCDDSFGNLFMALGFGGLHIIFGTIIAWRYGG